MSADDLILDASDAHRLALNLQARQSEAAGERDNAVNAALKGGASAVALAAALGVDRQRIYQMAKRGGGNG